MSSEAHEFKHFAQFERKLRKTFRTNKSRSKPTNLVQILSFRYFERDLLALNEIVGFERDLLVRARRGECD